MRICHGSGCAMYNQEIYPPGPCDCGVGKKENYAVYELPHSWLCVDGPLKGQRRETTNPYFFDFLSWADGSLSILDGRPPVAFILTYELAIGVVDGKKCFVWSIQNNLTKKKPEEE